MHTATEPGNFPSPAPIHDQMYEEYQLACGVQSLRSFAPAYVIAAAKNQARFEVLAGYAARGRAHVCCSIIYRCSVRSGEIPVEFAGTLSVHFSQNPRVRATYCRRES